MWRYLKRQVALAMVDEDLVLAICLTDLSNVRIGGCCGRWEVDV
jgi:hypothetical protein